MSRAEIFPHGQLPGPVPVLVVMPRPSAVTIFAPYLRIPGAMFVGAGAQLGGVAIASVIVVGISQRDEDIARVNKWMDEVVKLRLTPNALGILWL